MAETILIVDDDRTLRETLTYNLERQGYHVFAAKDGVEAIRLARENKPDLILLDLLLPRVDGLEVCRILRQEMNVPILMLTARVDEIDRVVGLELGADDYVTKPFSMRELLARVKAHLRRTRMIREELEASGETESAGDQRQQPLVFGDLRIDLRRREVTKGQGPLTLKPREYELLVFLARNRGMVLSRDLILERVWGWSYSGGSRTVDVHIRWL